MKALKEETTKSIKISNPFAPVNTEWLDITLEDGATIGDTLSAGLAIVTKEDEGIVFDTWNKWIVDVVAEVPELKAHITTRKTKKGKQYYGIDHQLWNTIKGRDTGSGLPAI